MAKYSKFAMIFSFLLPAALLAGERFKTVTLDDVDTFVQKQTAIIYDVNVASTRANVGTVPGAKLIDSSTKYDVAKELPADKASKLIFYCANPMCTSSHEAAERAIDAGYQDVSVMKDGIYGWKKAGKMLSKLIPKAGALEPAPSAKAIEPKSAHLLAKEGKAIIVDVREGEERHEVIENSKWFPMSKFGDAQAWKQFKAGLPRDKTVIFHCAAGKRSKTVAEKLAAEGGRAEYFKGPDQWKAEGLPLVKGPAH